MAGTRRPRFGCFGCLWQVLVVLVLCGIAYVAALGVFAPWAFYMGGKFHITPYWQGWGRAHTANGDYLIYVLISPSSNSSKMYLSTSVAGRANVCTPRGENLALKMRGGMRKHLNLSTDGESIWLGMHRMSWRQFNGDYSPSLELRGHWQNPNLAMDDEGSIAKAFRTDGTPYGAHDRNRSPSKEVVPIILIEGTYTDYRTACNAMRR